MCHISNIQQLYFDVINYRFLTTETNFKALYILVKLFEVTVQIFVYKLLFTITSQNLSHFKKELHENESAFLEK